MYEIFKKTAEECHKVYGVSLIYDENGEEGGNLIGFVCPECLKAIYFEDWFDVDNMWTNCPICDAEW